MTLRMPQRFQIVPVPDEKPEPTLIEQIRENDRDYAKIVEANAKLAEGDIEQIVNRLVSEHGMTERDAWSAVFRVPGALDEYREATYLDNRP